MAPVTKKEKPKAALISILAACTAIFTVATIGVPMLRDYYSLKNPSHGRLLFSMNPAACKATFKDSQSSLEPCLVESKYGFDPVTKELVVFLGLHEVRVPNWKDELVSIDDEPMAGAAGTGGG